MSWVYLDISVHKRKNTFLQKDRAKGFNLPDANINNRTQN